MYLTGFLVFFLVILLVAAVMGILTIVATWKLFTKSGEKGWKSIIPLYNTYTLMLLTKTPNFVIVLFAIGCALNLLLAFLVIPVLSFATFFIWCFTQLYLAVMVQRTYANEEGSKIHVALFILFYSIVLLIVGFSSKYQYKFKETI